MQIKIISLSLLNFKGIRQRSFTFEQITNIHGRNKLGKTTIMDAFLWLLFGKDSTDRKDFSIKTLDEHNEPYHHLDHQVTGVLEIDGEQITLRRLLQESWVKKRGSNEQEFKGHTTSYYWNDVPLKLEQYQEKIAEILPEQLFKLLTNTSYYSSLKWQDRRKILMDFAGEITNEEVFDKIITADNAATFQALKEAFAKKKSIEEFTAELSGKKKRLKDELLLLPSRIAEANNSLPDPVDYEAIQVLLDAAKHGLEEVDKLLMDKTQAQKDYGKLIQDKIQQVNKLTQDRVTAKNNVTTSITQASAARASHIAEQKIIKGQLETDIQRLTSQWTNETRNLDQLKEDKETVGKQWDAVNAETLVFKEGEFCCPACKREFEEGVVAEKKEELTRNFNTSKSTRLNELTTRGLKIKDDITAQEAKVGNLVAQGQAKRDELTKLISAIQELESEHTRKNNEEQELINQAIANSPELKAIDQQIQALQNEINAPVTDSQDNTVLLQQKEALKAKIETYTTQLGTKDQRTRILARIEELRTQESTQGTELAMLEGSDFAIEQFQKAKMDELENRINHRFTMVKFKMFEKQINGGLDACCETLISGVPYADANTASKINAGIDIINTLSQHYKVSAPVFVDNAESVNTLLPLNSQLIRLVVSLDDQLRIDYAAS